MTLLAQISDLHVTSRGERVCGRVDTPRFLERCLARLAAFTPRIDAILVTGDLVDRGTVEEYQTLRALFASTEVPTYLMLGNHDDRTAFRRVFGDEPYLRASDTFVHYTADVGPLRVIALDTHDTGNPRGGGRLCADRRAWLARALDTSRDRPVVLALHHPPFATGCSFMDDAGLDPADAAALADLVGRHANIERVICGHLHRPIHARFAGTIASTAPSTAHQIELRLAPGAPGAFSFEPPAFALHRFGPAGLVSHHVYVEGFEGPYGF